MALSTDHVSSIFCSIIMLDILRLDNLFIYNLTLMDIKTLNLERVGINANFFKNLEKEKFTRIFKKYLGVIKGLFIYNKDQIFKKVLFRNDFQVT